VSVRNSGSGLVVALALAMTCGPAAAQYRYASPYWDPYYGRRYYAPRYYVPRYSAHRDTAPKDTAHKDKAAGQAGAVPFADIPKGPLQIYVSIDQQKLHLYSDGVHVADSSVATGVPGLPTPLGVFSIIQKQRYHESNIYSNAPMPFMERITWSGVALHEGENIGHRASHGCIRLPHDFAVQLYGLTKLGVPVVVADQELKPAEFADPHLFVHKDKPPPAPAAVAAATPASDATTTPGGEGSKTADAAPADAPVPLPPDQLGLRVADPTPAAATPGPPAKPAAEAPAKKSPIAIFISRKEKRIYVRQDFTPLFDAPIAVAQPDQLFGTHVFTALEFLDDHLTLRWNVVSFPGEPPPAKPSRNADNQRRSEMRPQRDQDNAKPAELPPPQTPQQALARIDIPQNAIDFISQLMVPGSSLVVSDKGLGDETGDGTNFVVVTQ
jgi:lipoprotein-anchoring transpeptidase ErfK/SrfK